MQCNICFERIDVFACIPCNHNQCCAICLFKELTLFNNRKCPMCKVGMHLGAQTQADIKTPIFTVIPRKKYRDLQNEYRFVHNSKWNIDFDNSTVEKWFLDLLILRCTICDPFTPFGKINERVYDREAITDYMTVTSLQDHLKTEHGKTICSLCAKMNRMFPYELKQYPRQVSHSV